jgi:pimeloyl-ACP methyl ester carboxylesterase
VRGELCAPVTLSDCAHRIVSYAGLKSGSFESWEEAAAYFKHIYGVCYPGFDKWDTVARRLVSAKLELNYDPNCAAFSLDPSSTPEHLWSCLEAFGMERPLLIVRGAISDILTEETLEKMLAKVPAARAVRVPNVGHSPLLNEPEAWTAIAQLMQQE